MTKAYGCAITDSVKVTVNGLPTVGASATDSVICAGTSTTLSGSGATSYSWSGGATDNVPFTPSATTTFTVTGADANGCQDTDTLTITVNVLPAVTLTLPQHSLCVNNSPMGLTGESPSGGSWSGTAVSGSSFDPAVAGIGTFTVTYSYTDTNGCAGSATDTIAVDGCTGVRTAAQRVALYPNPASDELNIQVEGFGGSVSIELVNALGEVVRVVSSANDHLRLNLADLKAGVYIIRVSAEGITLRNRIIKQ